MTTAAMERYRVKEVLLNRHTAANIILSVFGGIGDWDDKTMPTTRAGAGIGSAVLIAGSIARAVAKKSTINVSILGDRAIVCASFRSPGGGQPRGFASLIWVKALQANNERGGWVRKNDYTLKSEPFRHQIYQSYVVETGTVYLGEAVFTLPRKNLQEVGDLLIRASLSSLMSDVESYDITLTPEASQSGD